MAVFSDEQWIIIINQFISNRKLISRPVLRTALHDKTTFCEHFQKMEEDFTESFVYMYPSMHIFKPPLLLFIISIV